MKILKKTYNIILDYYNLKYLILQILREFRDFYLLFVEKILILTICIEIGSFLFL